ncbi:hypothetical protein D3C71_1681450 [compost metagenome]
MPPVSAGAHHRGKAVSIAAGIPVITSVAWRAIASDWTSTAFHSLMPPDAATSAAPGSIPLASAGTISTLTCTARWRSNRAQPRLNAVILLLAAPFRFYRNQPISTFPPPNRPTLVTRAITIRPIAAGTMVLPPLRAMNNCAGCLFTVAVTARKREITAAPTRPIRPTGTPMR